MFTSTDPRDTVYIARQPILQPSGRVFGYELLYRAAAEDAACTTAGDMAGARVLTDAVLNIGLDILTDGQTAFLNLTRRLLLDGAATLLPQGSAVFELLEDIRIDGEVVDTCRALFAKGYRFALDDFVAGSDAEALLPFVKFVKVDVLTTPAAARAEIAQRLLPLGVRLIAEKVETATTAAEVRAEGYELVQGFFFCKPSTFVAPALPSRRARLFEPARRAEPARCHDRFARGSDQARRVAQLPHPAERELRGVRPESGNPIDPSGDRAAGTPADPSVGVLVVAGWAEQRRNVRNSHHRDPARALLRAAGRHAQRREWIGVLHARAVLPARRHAGPADGGGARGSAALRRQSARRCSARPTSSGPCWMP